jgi:hypothetical protein
MTESPDLFNYIAYEEERLKNANDTKMIVRDFEHLSEVEMKSNIKNGIYFQGKIIFQPNKLDNAIVRVHLFDKEIIIDSTEKINRAYHGDIVCVEILKESGNKSNRNIYEILIII